MSKTRPQNNDPQGEAKRSPAGSTPAADSPSRSQCRSDIPPSSARSGSGGSSLRSTTILANFWTGKISPIGMATLVVAALLFLPLYKWMLPDAPGGSSRGYGYGRSGTMKQIGLALLMYSGEYSGNFPPTLWTLYDEGILTSARMLASPADLAPEEFDPTGIFERYHYFGAGLRDDAADSTRTAVLVYPYRSGSAMHVTVLFVDGHVEGYYNQDLARILTILSTGQVNAEDHR